MPPSAENANPSEAEAELKSLLQTSGPELKTRTLTQAQAISRGLSQNYDIQIKTYDVSAAQADIRAVHGVPYAAPGWRSAGEPERRRGENSCLDSPTFSPRDDRR